MPKLTKLCIDALSADAAREYFIWDDELKGFGARVKPSGIISFLIQYRNTGGRSRKYTLGQYGRLTPDEARQLARQQLAAVARGEDPAKERADTRAAPTVADLAADYLERHAPKKRPRSISDDTRMIERHILPRFGRFKVEEVTRRDFERLHLALKDTPYHANRLLALLSKMFSLAVKWNWRMDNPVRGIERFPEEKRDRWLSEVELQRLLVVLRDHPNRRAARAVRFILLTGARRGEVLEARWEQFDFDRGVWTKPAHTTKQKRTEHVPLSPQALALLQELRAEADDKDPDETYVFPGEVEGQAVTDIKKFWRSVRKLASIPDVRLHDLRHTFASHLVSSGLSLPLVGKLLGHTQAATTQRYAHLADDPQRAAAAQFGALRTSPASSRGSRRKSFRSSGELERRPTTASPCLDSARRPLGRANV